MLYLAGIIITVFLAIILMTKKGKTAADNVLAVWLCLIGIHLFLYYGQITGEIFHYPYLLGIHVPFPLLHGPLLYLYTLAITRYHGFPKHWWLHFLPAVIAYTTLSKFYFLPAAVKIEVYRNYGAGFEIYTAVILIAAIISGFTYVLLSFYELKKYRRRIDEEFSDTEKINLNWLRYLVSSILVIWLIIIFNGQDPMIFGAVVVFVFFLGYFGIRHTGIFTQARHLPDIFQQKQAGSTAGPMDSTATGRLDNTREIPVSAGVVRPVEALPAIDRSIPRETPVRVKYEKSGLQKEAVEKIHEDLRLLVQKEKLFKKEEISLAELAGRLDIHPNNLSQVINSCENKSFYDYINSLRIEEFKTLVQLPENNRYTLLSLAFECGFNSKTSFNRNFKKITGLSPSAWLKEINVELQRE